MNRKIRISFNHYEIVTQQVQHNKEVIPFDTIIQKSSFWVLIKGSLNKNFTAFNEILINHNLHTNHILWVTYDPLTCSDIEKLYIGVNLAFIVKNPALFEYDTLKRLCLQLTDAPPVWLNNCLLLGFDTILGYIDSFDKIPDVQFLYWVADNLYFLKSYFIRSQFTMISSADISRIIELEAELSTPEMLSQNLPTVDEMARQANMSSAKFKLLFRKIFTNSPHQHFLNKKLMVVRNLLFSGKYTLTQVAYKAGFSHPSGLSKLFQRKFGINPSEFLEEKKSETLPF